MILNLRDRKEFSAETQEVASEAPPAEEGGPCPNGCGGRLRVVPGKNCSCLISPPCSRCVEAPLTCDVCGAEVEW
jgi:hypothetical protein